jgi:hypothetical protein
MPTDITDWNDLANIPANATGTYIQQNDIDDSSAGYSTHATDWNGISIGDGGEYNGNGYTIQDWATVNADTAAFFTEVAGYVHDLRMARMNHDTPAPSRTAIFVGDVTATGHIYKCQVEEFARSEPNNFDAAGFVVGNDGLIEDCIAEADVDNIDRDAIGFGVLGDGEYRRCVSMPTNLNSQGFGSVFAFSGSSNATFTNCHYSEQQTTADGSGATGHPQGDLTGGDAITTLSNFDFNNVWKDEFGDPPTLRDPAPPTTTIDLAATGSGTGTATRARLLFPPTDLSATGTATGTATASVTRRRNAGATASGTGTATASAPIRERHLGAVGGGSGVATIAAMEAITPYTDLSATGSGTGQSDGVQPVRVRSMNGEGDGTGDGQTTLSRRRGLSAHGAGSGAGTAVMYRVRPLTATGAGVGDGSASFVLVREGSGVISTPQNGVTVLTNPNVVELLSPAYNTVLPTDTIQDNQ